MKILILTPQLPYPPQQGTSLRNFYIIRGLAADQHQVSLLSFLEPNQTAVAEQIAPLHQLCHQIETVPVPQRSPWQRLMQLLRGRQPDMAHRLASAQFAQRLQQLLSQNAFDIVQIEGIELAAYLPLIRARSRAKIVFDNHNAETELQRRNLQTDRRQPRRWLAAAYSWVQVGRLARFERQACQTADWVTAVSAADEHHLQQLRLTTPVTVIPNCLDTQTYAHLPSQAAIPNDLLFSGKMDYRPNVDAVLWFADEVWPHILAKRPSARWVIVGQKPHPRLARLQQLPGVELTGWVEDVRPYLAGAAIFIMPFRVGSGTRLKLIEAMAAAKPIVSTAVGAEGFDVQPGHHLLIADSAADMATAVWQLLQHETDRQQLGAAAAKFAQQYDWRVVVPRFTAVYQQLITP